MTDEIQVVEADDTWEELDALQVAKSVRTMMKFRKADRLIVRHKGVDYPMEREKVEATIARLTPAPKAGE